MSYELGDPRPYELGLFGISVSDLVNRAVRGITGQAAEKARREGAAAALATQGYTPTPYAAAPAGVTADQLTTALASQQAQFQATLAAQQQAARPAGLFGSVSPVVLIGGAALAFYALKK